MARFTFLCQIISHGITIKLKQDVTVPLFIIHYPIIFSVPSLVQVSYSYFSNKDRPCSLCAEY